MSQIASSSIPARSPALAARRGISHTAAIGIISAATLALLLIYLGAGDPVDMMELFNLVPVKEAMRDGHWLMPTLNGLPRLEKPPLAAWIPAALGTLLHSDSLWVLRLGSLAMGILAALTTYGIGCMLFARRPGDGEKKTGGRTFALFAALFLPAMFVFNREARLATYDIYAMAWTTVAAYCLLKLAIDTPADEGPGERQNMPRAAGWTFAAGVSLGLALLSKGPAPPATVMIPLALWLAVYHRRRRVWIGFAIMALIGAALFLAWVLMVWHMHPSAIEVWRTDLHKLATGKRTLDSGVDPALHDPAYYYLQFLYWAAPLTPCLIAGLVMPFLPARKTAAPDATGKRAIWLMWLVTVGGLILLSIASEKKDRYSLQLFPFAALLCAAVWREFALLREDEPVDAGGKAVLAGQALFFIVPGIAGIAIALCVAITGHFFKWPVIATAVHAMGTPEALIAFAAVGIGGFWLWRTMARRQFVLAGWGVAVNACLLTFSCMWAYRAIPAMHTNPVRAPEQAAFASAREAGAKPGDIVTTQGGKPWLATDFFADQILAEMDAPMAAAWAKMHAGTPLYIVAIVSAGDPPKSAGAAPSPVEAQIAALETATGRKGEKVAQWTDEGRLTEMLKLP